MCQRMLMLKNKPEDEQNCSEDNHDYSISVNGSDCRS